MEKFEQDYNVLKTALAEVDKATTPAQVSAIDVKIGTALHSLQIGILAMAREVKQKVDDKKASLR